MSAFGLSLLGLGFGLLAAGACLGHLPSPLSMRILEALMRSLVVGGFSDALSDVVEHEDDFASAVGFGEDGVGEIEGRVGWYLGLWCSWVLV